jgi:WD40 repeat protein/serine/threonine protein kinase
MKAQDDLSGQTIKGFELLARVGAGGFGAVYRAYQPSVRREVAVKVILPEFVNNPDFVRRFEAEAQLVAHLEHPHIVPLYDYWRDATGAYLVMRWLKGGSLQEVLDKGHWPINDAARIMDQICSALAAAHRAGVIHRDIKPANILLDEVKNAYLADFGIAKDQFYIADVSHEIEAEEAAAEGFFGSPDYISPEQIRQMAVSPQSDIYNMGLLLYKLLTGRRPYEGVPLSTLISKHLEEPLPDLQEVMPDLPEALNQVIKRATEKDPHARYDDVLELAADLRRALSATPAEALSELEHRAPDAFTPEQLGIPADFLATRLSDLEPTNPYKGLRAFQEADADDFFGRETLTDALLQRLRETGVRSRFLVVIGPSGSGKSSAVKAGVLPHLRAGAVDGSAAWFIVEMTPGAYPLEELEASLLRVAINPPASLLPQLQEDTRGLVRAVKRILPAVGTTPAELVLYIDQFEEVFTQVTDESTRLHFLQSLLAAAEDPSSRLRVVVTLRADFYDRPLSYTGFGELVRECTEVVLPMTRDELHRAIMAPAEKNGLSLETGLGAAILADVGDQPGALPLIQYALTELFERREGRWLTLKAYQEIGGVLGALARRADDLYEQLSSEQQAIARQMFLRLVTLGEGSEDTRRRTLISELHSLEIDPANVQQVIDLFARYRLLTLDRDPLTRTPTVEVAHEALLRQWQTFRGWLDNFREDLRLQRRLASAAHEWRQSGEDTSYLASGSRLEQFDEWSRYTSLALTADERSFLARSLALREQRSAAEAARVARETALEKRSRRVLVALAAVMFVATLGALALSAFALGQQQRAEQSAGTATIAQGIALEEARNAATQAANAASNALIARNLALVSGSQLALANGNTDLAILLALEANSETQSTVQSRRALAEAAYAPGTRRVFTGHNDRVTSVAYSPQGDTVLSGARDNRAILTHLATGATIHILEGHTDWVWDVAYSPDGDTALTASQDSTLILWDLESGDIIQRFSGHNAAVRSVAFLPGGSQALSAAADGSLILWDLAAASPLRRFGGGAAINEVAVSPSGFTALTAGQDAVVTLWNLQTGQPLFFYDSAVGGHVADVWGVAYTPDETGFATASQDGMVLLWSFETGSVIRRFAGHNGRVTSLAFSPDGARIVSGSEDNTVILWDTRTAGIVNRFIGHTFLVYGVAYSPDGQHVVSASWDGSVRWWDLEPGAQIAQLGAGDDRHTDVINAVDISPDGRFAASASDDGSIIVWNIASQTLVTRFSAHAGRVRAVVFGPDGRTIASGGDDQLIYIWDAQTGGVLQTLEGHSDAIWALDYSSDGSQIASGSRDNTIIVWNASTGQQESRLFGHTFRVRDVDFSADATKLVSAGYDNLVIVWDAARAVPLNTLSGHGDWVLSATFSPDDKTVLSASADNLVILWDATTGEQLRAYEGHTALVNDASYSPDGRYIVSAAADRNIILWDLVSGQELQRFKGHTDAVQAVHFSPDQQTIVSASSDATVRIWRVSLTLDDLIGWTQANRYLRPLSCAERQQYELAPLCPTPTPVLIPGQTT